MTSIDRVKCSTRRVHRHRVLRFLMLTLILYQKTSVLSQLRFSYTYFKNYSVINKSTLHSSRANSSIIQFIIFLLSYSSRNIKKLKKRNYESQIYFFSVINYSLLPPSHLLHSIPNKRTRMISNIVERVFHLTSSSLKR